MQVLSASARSWPMLSAFGAGLVLLALAGGAQGAMRFILAGLGVAALGWGLASLRAGRVIAPAAVLGVAAAALVGAGALVVSGMAADTDVAAGPLAATSVFVVVVALACGLALRRRRGPARAPGSERTPARGFDRRSLAGLLVGAALVSALATPALAATTAGEHAVPHGTHLVDVELHGGHDH